MQNRHPFRLESKPEFRFVGVTENSNRAFAIRNSGVFG
jgi:hypothetical protein